MAKSVRITPEIEEQIRSSVGDPEFDASNVTVFEASLVTTEPVQKRGTIFENARIAPGVLIEAAERVNSEGGAVPVHTLHQSDSELPKGRVVNASVSQLDNGEMQLRGLFFLPNEEEDLISQIENSVVDEVSVGLKSQQMLCSECSFDFMGEDSDLINILERQCNNGHEIGRNGCHARLIGLDTFAETSLVSTGAAQNSKILSRAKQQLGSSEQERLAANGLNPEAVMLTATFPKHEEETAMSNGNGQGGGSGTMDLSAVTQQLTDLAAQVATKDKQIETLNASISEKDQQIEELKAKIPSDDTDPVQAALSVDTETAKARLGEFSHAHEKLAEHYKAVMTAAGEDVSEAPDSLSAMLEKIDEKGLKIHQALGTNGKSVEASADSKREGQPKSLSKAFLVQE
jgi:hypothetical protein